MPSLRMPSQVTWMHSGGRFAGSFRSAAGEQASCCLAGCTGCSICGEKDGGFTVDAPAESAGIARCPVCGGRGQQPYGFYLDEIHGTSTAQPLHSQCRTCFGSGVITI